MKALIISDLHLTDVKSEEYRWKVFAWAKNNLMGRDCLFILGDIFDKKDRHPATIVNRLTKELVDITSHYPVYMLKGNHDYIKPESPFLEFLSHLHNVTWIDKPTVIKFDGIKTLWLPHSRNPVEEWTYLLQNRTDIDAHDVKLVFMHQSIIGCRVSNYAELNCGMDLSWFNQYINCPIISGDIHVPQTIQNLTYVGTQHPVAFGDTYNCRALNLTLTPKKYEVDSIEIPGMVRHSLNISSIAELDKLYNAAVLTNEDQAKIAIVLTDSTLSNWTQLRDAAVEWCKQRRIELFDIKLKRVDNIETTKISPQTSVISMQPTDVLKRYYNQESIDPKIMEVGKKILNSVLNPTKL